MIEKHTQSIAGNLKKPIALVGMMGAGKSYIGQKLAKALDCEFHDSDACIEQQVGKAIAQIFSNDGEQAFRAMEQDVIYGLLSKKNVVIATGGGAVTTSETLGALKQKGVMIWLNPSLDTIWSRIKDEGHRPLLDCDHPQDVLENLMDKRRDLYAQAHIQIDDNVLTSEKSVEQVIKAINEHLA